MPPSAPCLNFEAKRRAGSRTTRRALGPARPAQGLGGAITRRELKLLRDAQMATIVPAVGGGWHWPMRPTCSNAPSTRLGRNPHAKSKLRKGNPRRTKEFMAGRWWIHERLHFGTKIHDANTRISEPQEVVL